MNLDDESPNLANGNDAKMHIIGRGDSKRERKNNNDSDLDDDKLNADGSSGDEDDSKLSRECLTVMSDIKRGFDSDDNDVSSFAANDHMLWCPYATKRGEAEFSDDDSLAAGDGALTPIAFYEKVNRLGRDGLIGEYNDIRNCPPDGTFVHARFVFIIIIILYVTCNINLRRSLFFQSKSYY